MNRQDEVLVIARPARFRDGIRLLLASIPLIAEVRLAEDIESALKITAVPALIIVDAAPDGGGLPAAVHTLKTAWPQAGLIALVEDERAFQAARSAGAHVPLRKGFPAATFIGAVETLLSR